MESIHVISHPAVQQKLSIMRSASTSSDKFRILMHEISLLLAYEASKNIAQEAEGERRVRSRENFIIPIMRGGLGMVNAFQDIIPESNVYHIGK